MNSQAIFILVALFVFLIAIPAFAIFAIYRWRKSEKYCSSLRRRYSGIIDVERQVSLLNTQYVEESKKLSELKISYKNSKEIYNRLQAEIKLTEDSLNLHEIGLYAPHFDFSDTEDYKRKIALVREQQKILIATGKAAYCTTTWTVNGSEKKGEALTKKNVKLTLRAFNNECDAIVANVRWNNMLTMENRLKKSAEQIENINSNNAIVIGSDYVALKLDELRLTHEYREKLKQEKEERAEAARLAREEQKLRKELEDAQAAEQKYERLLERARKEAENIAGPKLEGYKEKIALLEQELADARIKTERARALAEQTKTGYVYVISNVGSFSDDVVKIGLTRRLDPMDRVRELGDASVPFVFDTHAIIYSEDAPNLERSIHVELENSRINLQNSRKEFFKVSVDRVEEIVSRLAPGSTFIKSIEAQEYRETIAKRNLVLGLKAQPPQLFPDEI